MTSPQALRDLADRLDLITLDDNADFAVVDEAVCALRNIASRIDATLTPEVVEKAAKAACEAWMASPIGTPDGDMVWRTKCNEMRTRVRAALLAAVPLGEDAGNYVCDKQQRGE